MNIKRINLIYLFSYLVLSGLGFLIIPGLTLKLLFSNGDYGDVMPRLAGLFMLLLGGMVFQFIRLKDYRYFAFTVSGRTLALAVAIGLYFYSKDPFFITLSVIVLIGLVPSYYAILAGPKDE